MARPKVERLDLGSGEVARDLGAPPASYICLNR
jgi:hypothetical protein